LRQAQEESKKWVIEHLEFMADLRRYGITEPGKGLAMWVLEEAAKRHPYSYWAKDFLGAEELAAAQRDCPNKPGSPADWPR
jgi:hypothetical protein